MAQNATKQKLQRRPVNPLTAGLSGGASLLFVVALWLLFAPVSMGGKFAYFFVVGNSVEPHITKNDLVFLRGADRYDRVLGHRGQPDGGRHWSQRRRRLYGGRRWC